MPGYFTANMPLITGAQLSGDARIPVDTNLPRGQSPQNGGMIPGTLPAPAAQQGLTALAGGGKSANTTPLGYGVNQLTTVATAADSVLLPYAYPGAQVTIANQGAASAQVFGKGVDTINGVATGTGVAQGAGLTAAYIGVGLLTGDGTVVGTWRRILSA